MQYEETRFQTLAERRASQRRDVNWKATIRIGNEAPIPCRVINVSTGGALLELSDTIWLPADFRIVIPDAIFEATCDVRHQAGRRVGVMFTSNLREALARFS